MTIFKGYIENQPMKKLFALLFVATLLLAVNCERPSPDPDPDPEPEPVEVDLAKGADVSWLTQMEKEGCRFFTGAGQEIECMTLLKQLGVNSIRLRVWVNPEGGWCGKDDVVAKAKRAQALGMQVMIDFHYSDSWADPGKQNKPAAWKNYAFSALLEAVYQHTGEVLNAIKDAGVTPAWIQIGNETTGGMLWPDGQNYDNAGFSRYAQLSNMGYSAAKEVFPTAKVLVHIDKGEDASQLSWFFKNCEQFGLRYDMIGLSLYPEETTWRQYLQQLMWNIKNLYMTYEKDCMICEVGMHWTQGAECKTFLEALIASAQTEMEGHCHGVFYWEPEAYEDWSHYSKAAFDNEGRPTEALYAFSK